ncbi:uncharacterized [Tachysurus ichikawai]
MEPYHSNVVFAILFAFDTNRTLNPVHCPANAPRIKAGALALTHRAAAGQLSSSLLLANVSLTFKLERLSSDSEYSAAVKFLLCCGSSTCASFIERYVALVFPVLSAGLPGHVPSSKPHLLFLLLLLLRRGLRRDVIDARTGPSRAMFKHQNTNHEKRLLKNV